jgi:hypothetical protein
MRRTARTWPLIVLPLAIAVVLAVRILTGPMAPWAVLPVAFVLAGPLIAAGRPRRADEPVTHGAQPEAQPTMVPVGVDL